MTFKRSLGETLSMRAFEYRMKLVMDRVKTETPLNLERLLKDLGVYVKKTNDLPEGCIIKPRYSVRTGLYDLSVLESAPCSVQRYAMAHYLGQHLLYYLHEQLIEDEVIEGTVWYESGFCDALEREANQFAAWLLLPLEQVSRNLEETFSMKELGYPMELVMERMETEAPLNLERLIHDLGLELQKTNDLPNGCIGKLEYLPDTGVYRISVLRSDHYFRQRFTMAHELGHYILHRHRMVNNVIEDTTMYRSNFPDALEREANQFATAVLMPLEQLKEDYAKTNNLNVLAKKWQVSPAAMRIRMGLPS
jgi:Zn-dependent peptidase ImmA (M78 family)